MTSAPDQTDRGSAYVWVTAWAEAMPRRARVAALAHGLGLDLADASQRVGRQTPGVIARVHTPEAHEAVAHLRAHGIDCMAIDDDTLDRRARLRLVRRILPGAAGGVLVEADQHPACAVDLPRAAGLLVVGQIRHQRTTNRTQVLTRWDAQTGMIPDDMLGPARTTSGGMPIQRSVTRKIEHVLDLYLADADGGSEPMGLRLRMSRFDSVPLLGVDARPRSNREEADAVEAWLTERIPGLRVERGFRDFQLPVALRAAPPASGTKTEWDRDELAAFTFYSASVSLLA